MRCFLLFFFAISLSLMPPLACIFKIDNKSYLYEKILIEIDYSENTQPKLITYTKIKEELKNLGICKDITILISDEVPVRFTLISLSEIKKVEEIFRNHFNDTNSNILSIYLLCINGTYSPKLTTLGLTYSDSSCAILYPQSKPLEKSVILHEIGHLLLKKFPEGGHCPNKNCLMHPIIADGSVEFDSQCLERLDLVKRKKKQSQQRPLTTWPQQRK